MKEHDSNYHQITDPQINSEYHCLGTQVALDENSFDILREVRSQLPNAEFDFQSVRVIPYQDDLVDSGSVVRSLAQAIEGLDAVDQINESIVLQKRNARILAQLGVLFDTAPLKRTVLNPINNTHLHHDEKNESGEQDALESFGVVLEDSSNKKGQQEEINQKDTVILIENKRPLKRKSSLLNAFNVLL